MTKLRDPVEVGRILRMLRGIRPRTGVAKELGVSYSFLCKAESGLRKISDEMKVRIANYYNTPVEQIFYTHQNSDL